MTETSASDRERAILSAALFAVLGWVIPIATPILAAFSSLTALRSTGGTLAGAVLVLVMAAYRIRGRGKGMSGTEVSIYWLACVPAAVLGLASAASLSWLSTLHRSAQFRFVWGFAAGTLLVLAAAAVMIVRRRAVIARAELALYWLGTAIALTLALGYVFEAMGWSWWLGNPILGPSSTESHTSGIILGAALSIVLGVYLALLGKGRRSS